MSTVEYAKLVRINTEDSTTKGFQSKIKLPSAKSLPHTGDYINFYCGLGAFECGISAGNKPQSIYNGQIIWRWFANTPDWDHIGETPHGGRYYEGDTITILLARDNNDKVVFKVDGATVFTSAKTWPQYTAEQRSNTSRLIIASFQNTGVTPPLALWQVTHNQVEASEMKYKNSSDTWVSMTNANKVTPAHWPTNVPPNPNLIDYNHIDKSYMGSAKVYAAIKL